MDAKLLRNIVKSTNDIRKKYRAIKSGKIDNELLLEETFKPISTPLREIKEKTEEEMAKKIKSEVKKELTLLNRSSSPEDIKNSDDKYMKLLFKQSPQTSNVDFDTSGNMSAFKTLSQSTFPSTPVNDSHHKGIHQSTPILKDNSFNSSRALAQLYIQENLHKTRNIDVAFGPKYNEQTSAFEIGRLHMEFNQNTINIGENAYPGTQGLYELIFMKSPKDYTSADLDQYKDILLKSNVYKVDVNDDSSRTKGNSSPKYKNIICQLITSKKGSGLMSLTNQKPNYVYWDDPNELVERLGLLVASQQAGHTNHDNEIISIIEELREADIIA